MKIIASVAGVEVLLVALPSAAWGHTEITPEEQFELADLRVRAEQGDAGARVMLGAMYANGSGVPEDNAEAVRWYRLAAEQGYAPAQIGLGAMYANGSGIPEDNAEAVRWYRLAAEQGVAYAQGALGAMYATGRGAGGRRGVARRPASGGRRR